MAAKLKRLVIDRVDLVDKGANPDAHIVLFKRAEPLTKMDTHGVPMTTQEVLDAQERHEGWQKLRWAFLDALESITAHASPEEQAPLLLTAVEEFAANARAILATMDMSPELYKRATEGVVSVEKAGRVIAGQRLQRLKQAVVALQAIINEAEPGEEKGKKVMAEKSVDPLADVTKRAETAEAQIPTLQAQLHTLEKRATDAEAEVLKLQPVDPWHGVSLEVRKRIEDSEARVAKAEAEVCKRDCMVQARKYDKLPITPENHWAMFDALNKLPEDISKQVFTLLGSAQEVARQSGLFKAQGKNSTSTNGTDVSAVADADRLAKAYQEDHDGTSYGDAMAAVMRDPDLYNRYRAETASRV